MYKNSWTNKIYGVQPCIKKVSEVNIHLLFKSSRFNFCLLNGIVREVFKTTYNKIANVVLTIIYDSTCTPVQMWHGSCTWCWDKNFWQNLIAHWALDQKFTVEYQ